MIKTLEDILAEIQTTFIALQDKVKFFGINSVIRGIFYAISGVISEMYNDVNQIKRQIQLDTASGTYLDTIASWSNVTRKGASKSSVIAVFNGTATTTVPINTILNIKGKAEQYKTTKAITINNFSFTGDINSLTFGNIVIAESIGTGSKTRIGVNEISGLATPITGITSVVNLVPSTGGDDTETDEQLRERMIKLNETLCQGTAEFYEGIAIKNSDDVLQAYTKYNYQQDAVEILLIKRGGGTFADEDLASLADLINASQRGGQGTLCLNAEYQNIWVYSELTAKGSYDVTALIKELCVLIGDYVDNKKRVFGGKIILSDVVELILNHSAVIEMDLSRFRLNDGVMDVFCNAYKYPRLTSVALKINGTLHNTTINQTYVS